MKIGVKRHIGPVRLATWGYKVREGARGFAVSWVGQRIMLSVEIHFERYRR